MKIEKVTHHKIPKNGRVVFGSTVKIDRHEHCYLCGQFITDYQRVTGGIGLNIDSEYLAEWYDVVVDDTLYHLCSTECREVFRLTPIP